MSWPLCAWPRSPAEPPTSCPRCKPATCTPWPYFLKQQTLPPMHAADPYCFALSCVCSKVVRKSIARVLTVLSQNQRAALTSAYEGKVRMRVVRGTERSCAPPLCGMHFSVVDTACHRPLAEVHPS